MRRPLLHGVGWFVLANALLFKIIALVLWSGLIEPPADAAALLYRSLANFAHWPLVAGLLIAPPLVLAIVLRPQRHWAAGVAGIAGAAATVVILADGIVFAQYRMHLGSYVWGLVLGGAGQEIFAFSWLMWLVLGVTLSAALGLQALLFLLTCRLQRRFADRRLGRKLAAAWLIALLSVNAWHAWADAHYDLSISRENGYLPFYHPLTAKRALRDWGWVDPALVQASVDVPAASRSLHYPLEPLACRDGARINVLLIVIDSWRADVLDPQVTPRIHRFARESLRFQQHISGGNGTRFGLFSLFYGLPGNYWFPVLRDHTTPVLMREVLRQDYDLAILGSAPLVHPEFNITVFKDVEDLRLRTPGATTIERDRRVTADMLDFLQQPERQRQPFFGFLLLDAVHAYDFPAEEAAPFQPSWEQINYLLLDEDFDRTPYFNRYKNAVHFADAQVGKVLDALRANDLLEQTLVIITSDHGEEFNDSGKNYWGHNGNFTPYQVQVPLLVRWPGQPARDVTYLTSHYDIPSTLLTEVFGCSTDPAAYGIGLPLMQEEGRRRFLPVADYNDMGVYEPERITVFAPFGGHRTYTHDYDVLDQPLGDEVLRAVREDMLRFARPPVPPSKTVMSAS